MIQIIKLLSRRGRLSYRGLVGLFLLGFAATVVGQTTKIEGYILDKVTREPVIGASVYLVNEKTGTITDYDGYFTLPVESFPASIVAGFLGYKNEEVEIYEYTEPLRIILQEDWNLQDEVVVIGYGTQTRRELTSAVSTLSKDRLAQVTPTFETVLSGAVAGLNVTQTSGQPGATSTIRIRGGNSITGGNEPLYVIDGFIVYNDNTATQTGAGRSDAALNPLSTINTADIESIEVLKDVSATAIYGSRGSNGVIMITTKKGKKGSNTINYQNSFGWQTIRKKLDFLTAAQWAGLYNELLENDGIAPRFTADEIASLGKGTDWQDAALQTGFTQSHQLSFTGGDEKSRYAISGNYSNQEGIILNTDFTRYSARVNVERDLYENFRIGVNASGTYSTQHGLADLGQNEAPNTWVSAIRMSPVVSLYDDQGGFNYDNPFSASVYNGISANPISDLENIISETKNTRVIGNFYAEYRFLPELSAKINVGADLNSTKQNFYAPYYTTPGLNNNGTASVGNKKVNTWQAEFTANYDKQFNKDNSLNALLGYTVQQTDAEYFAASAYDFSNEATTYNSLQSAAKSNLPTSGAYTAALISWLGRVSYSYKERYNLTATVRADGSSRFAQNHKYGWFPSVGVSWNLDRESFLRGNRTISHLKLRASAGVTGNQEIGDYAYLATIVPQNYPFSNNSVTAYIPNNLSNSDLKWEKTAQYNIGVNWGLWNDRFNIVFDAYYKKTTDLLLNVPVEMTTGFSSILKNVGSVSNKGVELELDGKIIQTKDIFWNASFNIAKNINRVESLGDVDYFFPVFTQATLVYISPLIVKKGEPLGTYYGQKFDGIVQTGDDLSSIPQPSWYTESIQPGDAKYVDRNKDGEVTDADKTVLGNAQPKFTYGFSSTFTYKNLDLFVAFQGSYGNKLYNVLRNRLEKTTTYYNSFASVADRWTPENPSTTIARATSATSIVLDDRYIEDASYLRLKNITLGYTVPLKRSEKEIVKLRVFVTGLNLLTFTPYTGYDPEASRYGGDETNGLYQGLDFGTYPSSKSFLFGINVTL